MLRTSDLDYELPESRIATRPAEPRDSARLMVVSRADGSRVEHARVSDLPGFLRVGDVMVVNDTRVAPARLSGRRVGTGGRIEGLFLEQPRPGVWKAMLKSNSRLRPGMAIELGPIGLRATLVERAPPGAWLLAIDPPSASPAETLRRIGATPLPPYILSARRRANDSLADELDRAWYQTVYAREDGDRAGSVAAPTAGLHFTEELLERLRGAGVGMERVTLDVGPGTFAPVESETLEQHPMHSEWRRVPASTLEAVRAARGRGARTLAVGTTTARSLESVRGWAGGDVEGPTDLLIAPGHGWVWVDALMTNFHLPRSTLMALVASLLDGGVERLKELYRIGVDEGYRFYSYGDAMLVLP